jgi:hypothetical protein
LSIAEKNFFFVALVITRTNENSSKFMQKISNLFFTPNQNVINLPIKFLRKELNMLYYSLKGLPYIVYFVFRTEARNVA